MTMMLLERPIAAEPLLPPTNQVVKNRMCALAGAIGGLVDPAPGARDAKLAGCLLMPYAGLLLAGTSCRRPLLFPEGETLHTITGVDVILVRHDADRGTTYDLRLNGQTGWLCRYQAWQMEGGLWLVPDAGTAPSVRTTAWGLEVGDQPPFADSAEHGLGLIRPALAANAGRA
jgi:hypothetical protein